MIKGLRKKFILMGMLSVIIAELLMIGSIDVINYKNTIDDIKSQMQILTDNGGDLSALVGTPAEDGRAIGKQGDKESAGSPEDAEKPDVADRSTSKPGELKPEDRMVEDRNFSERINGETPFMLRYFTVTFDDSGDVTDTDTKRIAMVDENRASELGVRINASGKSAGFTDDYYYEKISTDDGQKIIFLDCRRDIASFTSFRNISIVVGVIGAALVFIILAFASKRVLSPVEESYRKQKRFITDASHEIKTPLAIISADAEVLELENEGSEWVESIKNQVSRLTSLTEKLVFLSRMDEGAVQMHMTDLDYSGLVRETAEAYIPMATSQEKDYKIDVEDGIHMTGDADNLTQMVNLLIDNAYKYSDEKGSIRVSLYAQGKKKVLEVYNTVEEIEKGSLNNLFERFYRSDTSRSSDTGGHGIGLSVVAAIATAHRGKAMARSTDGKSVVFKVSI